MQKFCFLSGENVRDRNVLGRQLFDLAERIRKGPSGGHVTWFILAGVVVLYHPFWFHRFGISDDYSMLSTPVRDPGRLSDFVSAMGRLVCGPLLEWTGRTMGTVDQLAWTRAMSCLGLMLWAFSVDRFAEKAGWSPISRVLGLAFILASPSASILAAWSVCWPYPYAALCSFWAFRCSEKFLERKRRWARSSICRGLGWMVLSALLLMAAAFVYQPFLFCYLTPLLIMTLAAGETHAGARSVKLVSFHLVWLFCIGVLSFSVYRAIIADWGLVEGERTALVADPLQKVRWLFTSLLPSGFNLVLLRGHRGEGTFLWYAGGAAVSLSLAYGCLRDLSLRSCFDSMLRTLALCVLVLASISLPLIVKESYTSYRILFPFVALVGLWVAWEWTEKTNSRRPEIARMVGFAVLIVALSLGVYRNQVVIAKPQSRELTLVENALMTVDWGRPPRIFIVQPTMDDALAPIVSTNEFGLPSTYADWAVEGIVWLFSRRKGMEGEYVLSYGPAVPSILCPETVVVDLPKLFEADR